MALSTKQVAKAAGMAAVGIVAPSPVFAIIAAIAEGVAKVPVDTNSNSDLLEVNKETERLENEMRRLEAQAKVAQEMAIASRIEQALEVQIEEFYEYAGEGKAGLTADQKGLTIGVSGAGKRISKRIYKFSGSIHGTAPKID